MIARLLPLVLLAACSRAEARTPSAEGRLVALGDAGAASEPTSADASAAHGGRAARLLTVDQFHAALVAATGFTWEGKAHVSAPDAPKGELDDPHADRLVLLAPSMGKPDYASSTVESREASITMTKLAADAARYACRASVEWARANPAASRRILHAVAPGDTLASNPTGVRDNARYLALRFWSRTLKADDADLAALVTVFDRASRAATPPDGWRAVCIALASDPLFLTY